VEEDVSGNVVSCHGATDCTINFNTRYPRVCPGYVDFRSAMALDFGLHGCGQKALIDEISGYFI